MDLKEQAATAAQHDATRRRIAREEEMAARLATSRTNLLNLMDSWGVPAAERDLVKVNHTGRGDEYAVILDGHRLAGYFVPPRTRGGGGAVEWPDGLELVITPGERSDHHDTLWAHDSYPGGSRCLRVNSLAELGRLLADRYIPAGHVLGYDTETGEIIAGTRDRHGTFTPKAAS